MFRLSCRVALRRSGSREQSTAKQAILDGAQLNASVALAILERGRALELFELLCVLVPFVQPGPSGDRELVGQVDLLDADEPRRREQSGWLGARGHRTRPRPMSAPSSRGRQAGSHVDRCERDPTAGPEKTFEGSQHGELRSQSTQNIREDDRVEGLRAKWLSRTRRSDERGAIDDLPAYRPACGGDEWFMRKVGAHR